MESINKKALVERVALATDKTKKETNEMVDAIFAEITSALSEGAKVDISGFGKFEVKDRKARKGINPVTKEPIMIAATKAPAFKASKNLKESVK